MGIAFEKNIFKHYAVSNIILKIKIFFRQTNTTATGNISGVAHFNLLIINHQ